jgi:hypothetical protein
MDFIFVSPRQKSAQRRRKEDDYRSKSKTNSKIGPFQALFLVFFCQMQLKFRERI